MKSNAQKQRDRKQRPLDKDRREEASGLVTIFGDLKMLTEKFQIELSLLRPNTKVE